GIVLSWCVVRCRGLALAVCVDSRGVATVISHASIGGSRGAAGPPAKSTSPGPREVDGLHHGRLDVCPDARGARALRERTVLIVGRVPDLRAARGARAR